MVGRVAGSVVLGLLLLTAAGLGAPPSLLLFVAGANLATLLLPGGTGAKAAGNLARRLYDRRGWERDWSEGYLPQGERARNVPSGRPDPRLPRGFGETLEEIRSLPEIDPPRRRRAR